MKINELKPKSISVIVTTYNRPEALRLVLRALAEQDYRDFEVIVADDGSGDDTKALVIQMAEQVAYPLQHVWQEDDGFRAAAIRNKATVASGGDYIIYLDGDCIPLPNFIKRHVQLAEAGRYVAGNRVLLSQAYTERVLEKRLSFSHFAWWQWMRARRLGHINRLMPLLYLPGQFWRKCGPNKWYGVKTCNLGIWKQELLAVNGLDEEYAGWGYEDSDLVIRLMRHGVKYKSGKFATPVLHLWHDENDRSQESENYQRLEAIQKSEKITANRGIDQYL